MTGKELQALVPAALEWETASLPSQAIVPGCATKLAAEHALRKLGGVSAIHDQLKIRPDPRPDRGRVQAMPRRKDARSPWWSTAAAWS